MEVKSTVESSTVIIAFTKKSYLLHYRKLHTAIQEILFGNTSQDLHIKSMTEELRVYLIGNSLN